MKEMITVEREKLERHLQNLEDADVYNNQSYIIAAQETIRKILNPTPTMKKADWQRVIDEKFYVRYVVGGAAIFLIDDKRDTGEVEVVREKGLRQPHFKGHPHPDGDDEVLVIFNDKTKYHGEGGDECISWDDVREYICL